MPYKHGVYGNIIASQAMFPPTGVATLPVYIGTAPVNFFADPEDRFEKVVIVNSYDEAKAALGYSDDWSKFSLCEAIFAHFQNAIKNIGPVVMINVLDPATHTKEGTASVALTTKVGYIDKETVILSSCAISGKVLDTDFTAEYVEKDGKMQVKITDKTVGGIASPATVTFDEWDFTLVDATDISAGLAVVPLIYQETGYIPTILAAPGFSQDPDVYTALVSRCQGINSHWDAICNVDIDSSDVLADTIAEAKTWKTTNGYISKYSKVCWPKVQYGTKKFWMSTLATVRMQQTDYDNSNIPFESPSNKPIMGTGTILPDGTEIKFDEVDATGLNEYGITTMAYVGGRWVLWGPHNGNYTYASESSIKPEDMFDCSIRMQQYIKNTFQKDFMGAVDSPFTRRKIEEILDNGQIWLNSLVAEGALLYAKVAFNTQNNPTAQLAAGNFVFDIADTNTPPGKSITFNVQYDLQGLSVLTEGGAQ